MASIDDLRLYLDNIKADYKIESVNLEDDETINQIIYNFPVSRDFEEIRIREDDVNLDNIMKSKFFTYRGISNYEAIWSADCACIESEVVCLNSFGSPRLQIAKLVRLFEEDKSESCKEPSSILNQVVIVDTENMKLSIGYSSKEFAFYSSRRVASTFDIEQGTSRFRLTLKIENITLKSHDYARSILEKVSNTIFFQINLFYNSAYILCPKREDRAQRLKRFIRSRTQITAPNPLALKYEYDDAVMQLYWLAQNNSSSPFFRYFALYQVLEYYFPIYSKGVAKLQIQNMIKDPCFNVARDADVVRLLDVISNSGSSMNEKGQLHITLKEICSGEDIINFVKNDEQLLSYYNSKKCLKLSERKVRMNDIHGVLEDFSERIYQIRCGIVHNKASEVDAKILPLTNEMDSLIFEIIVLEFLVRKAIIANSRPFML